eukprot:29329-Pleurochrysis_carterae.AAC.2
MQRSKAVEIGVVRNTCGENSSTAKESATLQMHEGTRSVAHNCSFINRRLRQKNGRGLTCQDTSYSSEASSQGTWRASDKVNKPSRLICRTEYTEHRKISEQSWPPNFGSRTTPCVNGMPFTGPKPMPKATACRLSATLESSGPNDESNRLAMSKPVSKISSAIAVTVAE